MPHHDEKGRITPAKSNLAKSWRTQTKEIAEAGRGYHRAAIRRDIMQNKSQKLKLIKRARGGSIKSQVRRDETKGRTEYLGGVKGQRAYKKAHEERY